MLIVSAKHKPCLIIFSTATCFSNRFMRRRRRFISMPTIWCDLPLHHSPKNEDKSEEWGLSRFTFNKNDIAYYKCAMPSILLTEEPYLWNSIFYNITNNTFLNFICHICHHHGFLIEIQRVICVANNYCLQYLPRFCHIMWQKQQNMPHKTALFRKKRLKNSSFDHQNSAYCAKIMLTGAK